MSTVQKIWNYYERKGKTQPMRTCLGCSELGDPCARKLWLTYRHVDHRGKKLPPRMFRLFETGKYEEPRVFNDLRAADVEITAFDSKGNQIQVSHFNGKLKGHLDGEGIGFEEAPEIMHIVEVKTANEAQFRQLLKKGMKLWKFPYYAQTQMYMGFRKLTHAIYVVVCKNNDDIYFERIEFDQALFESLLKKADYVITSAKAPKRISNDPASYLCSNCSVKAVCHGREWPLVNCRTCIGCDDSEIGDRLAENPHRNCTSHLYNPELIFGHDMNAQEDYTEYTDKETGEIIFNVSSETDIYKYFDENDIIETSIQLRGEELCNACGLYTDVNKESCEMCNEAKDPL